MAKSLSMDQLKLLAAHGARARLAELRAEMAGDPSRLSRHRRIRKRVPYRGVVASGGQRQPQTAGGGANCRPRPEPQFPRRKRNGGPPSRERRRRASRNFGGLIGAVAAEEARQGGSAHR